MLYVSGKNLNRGKNIKVPNYNVLYTFSQIVI